MIDKEQKNISQSQGLKVSRLADAFRSRNRIEEALLPILEKRNDEVQMSNDKKDSKPKLTKTFFLGLLSLIVLIVFATGGYLIYRHLASIKADDPATVLAEVGKLVALPAGEEPTIATISDLAPLKGQAFFADATIGDKVLIFGKSKKAILYRPSTNKVVTVAPLK